MPLLLDAERITALYRRHAQRLLVFFQRRVQDPELAVDLVADTFETVVARRAQFRGETEEELSGWLWRIALSALASAQVREQRASDHARDGIRVPRALTDAELDRVEELAGTLTLRTAVTEGLGDLPEDTRAAVRMHVVEGLSYATIAERLGIRQDAARARVMRAMRQLHRRVGPAFDAWREDR
ncbi:RNA polymerase sigma factor [Patulibacter sp. SYSU D01012]|uniref:RNA polymerase sigma factor n=1 Tax=Patulibacter sp. SYSU D01012 TaxID=2817381 RepID=UPI001B30FAC0